MGELLLGLVVCVLAAPPDGAIETIRTTVVGQNCDFEEAREMARDAAGNIRVTKVTRRFMSHEGKVLCERVSDFRKSGGEGQLLKEFAKDEFDCGVILGALQINQDLFTIGLRFSNNIVVESIPLDAGGLKAVTTLVSDHVVDVPYNTPTRIPKITKGEIRSVTADTITVDLTTADGKIIQRELKRKR